MKLSFTKLAVIVILARAFGIKSTMNHLVGFTNKMYTSTVAVYYIETNTGCKDCTSNNYTDYIAGADYFKPLQMPSGSEEMELHQSRVQHVRASIEVGYVNKLRPIQQQENHNYADAAEAFYEMLWDASDINMDNHIDHKEFHQLMEAMKMNDDIDILNRGFQKMDLDSNGALNDYEWKQSAHKMINYRAKPKTRNI